MSISKALSTCLTRLFYFYIKKESMQDLSTDFRILRVTRQNILRLIKTFDIDQLNTIPEGFNNNLAWNFCHVVVTQQLLCYKLAGKEMVVSNDHVEAFRKGSKPEDRVSQETIDLFIELATTTADKIEQDYTTGHFDGYKDYTTSYGMTLTSPEDAIRFNNVHEALHLGTILDLKKLV